MTIEIEFEDGLINLKNTFFKSKKVLEFLIFKSKLFISITGDGKKELLNKNMFTTKEGNHLIISSCIICFANARKCSKEIPLRLTFK